MNLVAIRNESMRQRRDVGFAPTPLRQYTLVADAMSMRIILNGMIDSFPPPPPGVF